MRRLLIIGAGGFGRELESWLSRVPKKNRTWELLGYLDDNLNALDGFQSDYRILSKIDDFVFDNDDLAVLGLGNPEIKERIVNKLSGRVEFLVYIDDTAVVGKYTQIGIGAVVCPNAMISTNVTVGDFVTVNCGTQIGHDSEINDFSSLMCNVDLGGGCQIGRLVYMGTNSALAPRKSIGDGAKVSMGSIVTRNLKSPGVYWGNPARKI
jgi:sugar O-acyltransferase (sialic acid O-acetyltransferase NeuD family)